MRAFSYRVPLEHQALFSRSIALHHLLDTTYSLSFHLSLSLMLISFLPACQARVPVYGSVRNVMAWHEREVLSWHFAHG